MNLPLAKWIKARSLTFEIDKKTESGRAGRNDGVPFDAETENDGISGDRQMEQGVCGLSCERLSIPRFVSQVVLVRDWNF